MSAEELALLEKIIEQNQCIVDINFMIVQMMVPSEFIEVEMPEDGTKH